jgi:hypothetical protein
MFVETRQNTEMPYFYQTGVCLYLVINNSIKRSMKIDALVQSELAPHRPGKSKNYKYFFSSKEKINKIIHTNKDN